MQSLRRFLRLSRQERTLIIQAIVITSALRLSLPWLSLQSIHRLAVNIRRRSNGNVSAYRIVWAVRSAARLIPGSTCLVQALAAQALLIRHGYTSGLTIGVTKNERDRFGAHAWITCGDEVLMGGHETENYTALLILGS